MDGALGFILQGLLPMETWFRAPKHVISSSVCISRTKYPLSDIAGILQLAYLF
jgi:hypothetical protein